MDKRQQYEAALRGVVDAVHGVVIAMEALALAGKAWDPDGMYNDKDDPAAHAAIASCSAMLAKTCERYPGAAQMLGIDHMIARAVAAHAAKMTPAPSQSKASA